MLMKPEVRERINLMMDSDTIKNLRTMAKQENRKMSAVVEIALKNYFIKNYEVK